MKDSRGMSRQWCRTDIKCGYASVWFIFLRMRSKTWVALLVSICTWRKGKKRDSSISTCTIFTTQCMQEEGNDFSLPYRLKTFWQSQLILISQHFKVVQMPESVRGNGWIRETAAYRKHSYSRNPTETWPACGPLWFHWLCFWSVNIFNKTLEWVSSSKQEIIYWNEVPSYLSNVEFSWERSLSITGCIPSIRNSYRRWIRNSKLVCI